MSCKPYASDWQCLSDDLEFSASKQLYWCKGRVYDELLAQHNGIIGQGALLRSRVAIVNAKHEAYGYQFGTVTVGPVSERRLARKDITSDDLILWPCGTWCYRHELLEFTHKSDDYEEVVFGSARYELLCKELSDE